MPPSPPLTPAARFARLIAALCEVVAASRKRLAGPLIILIWTRLRRMALRVDRVAARVASGPLPPPRPRSAAPRRQPVAPPAQRLPRGFAWLVRLAPQTAFGAGQLQALLDDPAMQGLIAAAPQIGRTLRPLCRMLGVHPPPSLRRPSPAGQAAPRPALAVGPVAADPPRARSPRPAPAPPAPGLVRRACAPPLSACPICSI
jgi:hypothetical protein